MRQQATSSASAPKLGDTACAFPLLFPLSPFLFSITLSSRPTPPFSLNFSPLLAAPALVSLLRSLCCPHFPVQICRVSCLFICEERIPFLLTAAFLSPPYFQSSERQNRRRARVITGLEQNLRRCLGARLGLPGRSISPG